MIEETEKINGISLEGTSKPMNTSLYDEFKTINSNWVSLMPYAYMQGENQKISYKGLDWQWWGEGAEGVKTCAIQAHKSNIRVMIKPHLWIRRGEFTGTYNLDSESQWAEFERDYKSYILDYAILAESIGVEMFCIGTEMENFVLERTEFWNGLIDEIRTIYKGKLTYAANWNEYTKVPFWNKLDYIGIDAYFPIVSEVNPTAEKLQEGWKKWLLEIETIHQKNNIPILFTEYGYRSIEGTAIEPWSSERGGKVNMNEQTKAYEALYQACWNKKWMAGGFLWKWHAPQHNPEKKESRFTPQFKPALEVIKNYHSNSNQ